MSSLELNDNVVETSIRKVQGSFFKKQAKGQYLLPKHLITSGAQHMLCQQYTVTTDSMMTITGNNASPF
jgi:hypothetical protein